MDVIIQGRKEGEGCYCSVNNILKNLINILIKIYEVIIIDSPAGLEFFARKTSTDVDDLILVTDPSKMSFHTLQRIIEVKEEVSLNFKKIWILGNKFNEESKKIFIERFEKQLENKAKLLGFFNYYEEILKFNLDNNSILDLSERNSIYQEAIKIYSKLI